MTDEEYKKYREEQMKEGQEYQDFVCQQLLFKLGFPIVQYCSKKYQYEVGESACGFEIKHDKRLKETGNLYIEIAEKSKPSNEEYISSGIYRDDNSWLYLIGNYEKIYIFGKRHLRKIYEDPKREKTLKRIEIPTSKGFLLSAKFAEESLCIKLIEFNKGTQYAN
jgi:hypothetical protein